MEFESQGAQLHTSGQALNWQVHFFNLRASNLKKKKNMDHFLSKQ